MIIAVDVDEVLSDTLTSAIQFHNNIYGTTWKSSEIKTDKFWEIWGKNNEEKYRITDEFCKSTYFYNTQPIKGAVEGINALSDKGYSFIIITTRPIYLASDTKQWLNRYFPGKFNKIYHVFSEDKKNPQSTKLSVCKELKLPLIIDDSLSIAQECAKGGIKVLLLDYPWNQIKEIASSIYRVYSWQNIVDKCI